MNLKKIALFIIKIAIAAGLIYWLVSSNRLSSESLTDISWSVGNIALVIMQVILVVAGLGLLALRLKILLGGISLPVSYGNSLRVTALGAFAGSVLPGLVGGDAVKLGMLMLQNSRTQSSRLVIAVIFDRAIGVFSLILLGALAYFLAATTGSLPPNADYLYIAPMLSLIILAGVLLLRWLLRREEWLNRIIKHGPNWLPEFLGYVQTLAGNTGLLLKCIGLSLMNHALICCSFLVAAHLIGNVNLSILQQFVFTPLAMVMNILPITPGGLGITEAAFSYLYETLGCSVGADIGLIGRLIQYLSFTLVGVPCLIWVSGLRQR